MREIKFRAWDKNKNRMLSHSDLFAMDCSTDYPFLALIKGYYANSGARFLDGIDPVTMQYTGLKDKNGKEIYEGDICRFYGRFGIDKGVIKFLRSGFHIIIGNATMFRVDEFSLEIIGNIYENPELLEEKQ